jgi:3-dehydroquinate dehydratase-2
MRGWSRRAKAGPDGQNLPIQPRRRADRLAPRSNATGAKAVILNGGAYTHTSVAIHDAIKGITVPVIEVHLSNPHKREEFRHKSYIGMAAMATIAGFGARSYTLAIEAVAAL